MEEAGKIVLLGSQRTGKTSIIFQYIDSVFHEAYPYCLPSYVPSLATLSYTCQPAPRGRQINLALWEINPEPRFDLINPTFWRNTHIFIIVYDITSYRSFEEAKEWVAKVEDQPAIKILLGNKRDLEELRQVERRTAEAYALS